MAVVANNSVLSRALRPKSNAHLVTLRQLRRSLAGFAAYDEKLQPSPFAIRRCGMLKQRCDDGGVTSSCRMVQRSFAITVARGNVSPRGQQQRTYVTKSARRRVV